MDAYGIISIAFLAAYLFIGLYAGRKTHSVEDHFVMSRSAPAFFIMGTLIASNLSSVTFTGFTATVITSGPLAMITQFGATITAMLFIGLYAGRYLYRMKLLTIPDFFAKRYPGKYASLAASLIVLISMTAYMITVTLGSVVVISNIFGWSLHLSLLAIMSIITVFTVVGGMRSVVVTDTAMFVVFLIAALVIGPSVVVKTGGLKEAIGKATESLPYLFRWHGNATPFLGFMAILEMNVLSWLLNLGAPHLISRVNIAKSERELGKSMIYLAVVLPILIIALLYPFSFFPLLGTDVKPVESYVWVCKNLVPTLFGAIGLAGVVAAAISTATSLFQQASATLSSCIIKDFFFPNMDDKRLLLVSRISVVVIGVIVYFGSLNPSISGATIMYAFLFATAAFGAWIPAIYMGLLWRRATTAGATWSMFTAMPLIIFVSIGRQKGFLPSWIPTNLVGVTFAFVVMYVVSLLTKEDAGNKVYDEIHAFDAELKKKPKPSVGLGGEVAVQPAKMDAAKS